MVKFIKGLAALTWIGGAIAALAYIFAVESILLGVVIILAAVIQGALLWALAMVLQNTETTLEKCRELKTQLDAVQRTLKNMNTISASVATDTPAGNSKEKAAKLSSNTQVEHADNPDDHTEFSRCRLCGHRVNPALKFCSYCGMEYTGASAPVKAQAPKAATENLVCPKCGKPITLGLTYCHCCGAELES